jgi:hypothetical protein
MRVISGRHTSELTHQHVPRLRHALRAGTMDKIEQCVTDVAAIDAEADD